METSNLPAPDAGAVVAEAAPSIPWLIDLVREYYGNPLTILSPATARAAIAYAAVYKVPKVLVTEKEFATIVDTISSSFGAGLPFDWQPSRGIWGVAFVTQAKPDGKD